MEPFKWDWKSTCWHCVVPSILGAASPINWQAYRPHCGQYCWAWTLPPSQVGLKQALVWSNQYGFGLFGVQVELDEAQDWLFMQEGRLLGSLALLDWDEATAEQWGAVRKSQMDPSAHTHGLLESALCLFFFSFPTSFLFLFWQVSYPHFWLGEGGSHIMAGQFRRRGVIEQGRGLMLWNAFTFWNRSSTD